MTKQKHILIISGHTDLKQSVVNKTILDTLAKELPEARIEKLDELYPDYKIDIKHEQENLIWADVIILQFPVFWYSMPSIMERWMEQTFVHGFSHGSKGDKLKGKQLILSYTTGAPASMYSPDGPTGHVIDDFFINASAICHLTQMQFCGRVFTGGCSYANRTTPELIEEQKQTAIEHAKRLEDRLREIGAI